MTRGGALPQRHRPVSSGRRAKGRRFYGQTKFTPEQVRRRDSRARWQKARIFHGGCYREVRFKELTKVYWQGGARKRPVRLLVVAPVGYRTSKNGRKYYRQPAYLLTTDLTTDALVLLQAYFDRWGIEVNHRDEKDILGVGQAQVWNENSVSKVPALLVAMYSWLLVSRLAMLRTQTNRRLCTLAQMAPRGQAALLSGLGHAAAQATGRPPDDIRHRQGPGHLPNHGRSCRRLIKSQSLSPRSALQNVQTPAHRLKACATLWPPPSADGAPAQTRA